LAFAGESNTVAHQRARNATSTVGRGGH
jgi:hypothetical protein